MREILVKVDGRPVIIIRFLSNADVEVQLRSTAGEEEHGAVENNASEIAGPADASGVELVGSESAPTGEAGVSAERLDSVVDSELKELISSTLESVEAESSARGASGRGSGERRVEKKGESASTSHDVGSIIRRIVGVGVEE